MDLNARRRRLKAALARLAVPGQDVTEQREILAALAESHRRLETLLGNLPGMAYRCRNDADWTMEFVSEGCLALTGYQAAELVGNARLSYADVIHPEDREAVWTGVQAGVNQGRPFQLTYRIVTADGAQRWVWEQGRGVFEPDGQLAALEGFITDITERVVARERYRTLFETMGEGAFYQAADGRAIDVNPAALALFGLSRDQFLGRTSQHPDWRVIAEDGRDLPPEEHPSMVALRTGRPVSRVVGVFNPERGDRVWLNASARPLFGPGADPSADRPEAVFVTLHDLTERKRREADLARHAADLAQVNEDLGRLAYVVSHDLQEPLRMITSYTQLLERRFGDRLDALGLEFMHYVVDGAQRMQQMLDGMLAYSRVNRKGKDPTPTPAGTAVDQALANLRLTVEARGARVERGPLPTVLADPGQLLQLFQNLIGNAIKFSPGPAPRVEIAAAPAGNQWQFAVRDQGIGIDPAQGGRIFELFARLHPPGDYPGTGIGLSVCKKIVERHGGRLWVESQPGAGTTFFFTLPGAAAPRRTEET